MGFVGGYPYEWYIFIENLTDERKKHIIDINVLFFDMDKYQFTD